MKLRCQHLLCIAPFLRPLRKIPPMLKYPPKKSLSRLMKKRRFPRLRSDYVEDRNCDGIEIRLQRPKNDFDERLRLFAPSTVPPLLCGEFTRSYVASALGCSGELAPEVCGDLWMRSAAMVVRHLHFLVTAVECLSPPVEFDNCGQLFKWGSVVGADRPIAFANPNFCSRPLSHHVFCTGPLLVMFLS